MKTLHTIYTNFAKQNLASLRLLLVMLLTLTVTANAWGEEVKYTVSSTSAVTVSGKAPTGSSASYNSTYSNAKQLTSGNSMTLTLSGYEGCTITGLTLSMKSNTEKGAGNMSMKIGSTTAASISTAKFNTSSWHGSWSTSYVDVTPSVTAAIVGNGEKIVITIAATENSLYCQSFTLIYEPSSTGGDTSDACGWVETELDDVQSSDVIIITMTNSTGTTYAMSNNNGTGSAPAAVEVEVDGTSLTSEITDNIKWNVGGSNDAYTFYPNGDASKWLYATSTNNGVRVGTNANKTFKIDATSGYLFNNETSRYIGVYNSQDWRCYTPMHDNIKEQTLKFYKYVPCGPTETTITFDSNGGVGGPSPVTATKDKEMPSIASSLPSRTGHTLKGYYDAESEGTKYYNADGTSAKVWDKDDAEYTLYAQWTPNQHTLTWDLDGGKVTVAGTNADVNATGTPSGNVAYGTSIQAPQVAKTGYTFNGWSPEFTVGTTMPDDDLTYTAQWTANTYTVKFDPNGGTGTKMVDQTFTYGVSQTLSINTYTKSGHNFAGWATSENGSVEYTDGASVNNLTASDESIVTLYAQWTPKPLTNYRTLCTYEIILDKNGGTTDGSALVTASKTALTAINPPVYAGHQIAGYYYEPECNTLVADVEGNLQPNTPYTNANREWTAGEVTLYPKWEALEYTVTWVVGGDKDKPFATTTASATTPLVLPDPAPANDALGCCADAFIGWSTKTNPTKAEVFNDVANAPEITGNQTFHAVFATTTLTEGSATATFNEMGYTNAEKVTEIALGDGEGHGDATILFAKEQSAPNYPAYYTASGALHAYAKNTITINSTSATSTITNVQFTFAAKEDGSNTISANVGTYADGTWSGSAESVVFTIGGETGHRKITSITVTTQAVEQYTNYVTKCIYGNSPTLGAATVTYNSGDGIDVRCEQTSTMNKAATLTFPNAADLTCPITLTASAGFLISTSKSNDAGYQTSLTVSPYKSGSAQAGKLRTIYVRANAIGKTENYSGTITILKTEGEEETKSISITANVNCQSYTLKTVDHLGTETVVGNYYAGQIIEEAPKEPKKDDCSTKYTFDGWSESAVEYGSLVYNQVTFPFTMPAENVTLIPVYRLLEDVDEADYHRVTSDLGADDVDGNNWAGDYLIAASDQIFANGSKGGIANDPDYLGGNNSVVNPGNDLDGNIVKEDWGDQYKVAFINIGDGYYVLQTQDGMYNYITNGATSADLSATNSINTASVNNHPLSIIFDEINNSVRITNPKNATGLALQWMSTSNSFRFSKSTNPIYLYKKSPLYTTSLICEEVTASDALVTSTADQTVKVNVPITLTSSLHRTTDITAESDNTHFTITNLSGIEEGNHTLAVHYRPTVTTDGIETANIKIKVNNLPVNTFQVTGRHLPENFVIAAKAGGEWVALTAKVSNGTQVAVPIIVDDKTAPTKAIVALNTCQYKLLGLTNKNRFDVNGTAVHLYSTQTEKVLNASTASGTSTYLNTDATHDNAEISDNALFYEWQLVTEDLKKYTITNSNTTNTSNTRLGYSAATGQWGMYVNNVNVNQELYLLPIESHFTELNVEVMEWGTNSMALRIDGTAPSKLDVTLGENTNTVTLANLNSGNISDIYKAEGIDLTTNDCEIMKIVDNANPNSGTLIRKPILVNTTEAVSSTYRTKLTDDYCAHCDIVILKDAKLTADQGIHDHTSFAKIYVYPGGKLVLDAKSLGVKQQVYLRGGYSWLNSKYALPELYLNGTIDFNGSGNIIYDYYIKNYQYYQFSLPYDVQLAKVTDEAGIDNFPVWVKHYNGALRAADPHATSWEWYPSENGDAKAYFKAGEGYIIAAQPRQVGNTANRPLSIIRFPLGNKAFNSTNGIETDLTITTTAHGIGGYNDGTVTANNVGWNFIGNPFMATWKGDIGYKQLAKHPDENNWDGTYHWVDSDVKYITIMSAESGSDYKQYIASNTELKPFFPFYLQETAVGGSGEITFATSQRIQKAPAMLLSEQPRKAFIQIEIIAEEEIDQTGLFVCDKYSDDIDFDDYEKMFGTSTELPKLWIMHDDKRMAFEAMTESTAATYIPLGYRAPKIGKYIFAINEEASKVSEVEAVYLTDNQTGVTDFDLLSSAYEFESNGELYNDSRFTIRIVLRDESSSTVTGVDNVLHFNSDHPYKFIYQDKMYILRNGLIYDAMGKQVQTINK